MNNEGMDLSITLPGELCDLLAEDMMTADELLACDPEFLAIDQERKESALDAMIQDDIFGW